MLTSLAEFKYYQSFRVPVESRDDVLFFLEQEDEYGKFCTVNKVKLMDVSMTGMGFTTDARIAVGETIRCAIQFKRFRHEFNATIVRAFNGKGDSPEEAMMNYGAELDKEEFPPMKRFIEQYVNSLPPERLKDSLTSLALTERFSSAEEGFEMFSLLLSLFKDITQFGNKEKFIESMLEEITRILNAQRATIFLINPDSNELEAVAALGIQKEMLKFDYRKGIAGSVFTTGVSLNIDCKTDKVRFSEEIDKVTGFLTKSIICAPIHNREDKIIGVIEILNKRNEDRFTAEDEKTMKVLGLICSSVFHNYNPISEKSLIRRFSTPYDREHAWIGRSPSTGDVRKSIVKLKDIDSPLLISGEAGTGKRLLARIMHNEGKRGLHPFHQVNCQGVDPADLEKEMFSKLEECVGGTVSFAEISHMPLNLQQKLHHCLKERRVEGSQISLDVRVIATTSVDLKGLVEESRFNPDLLHLLGTSEINVEPLRKRKPDVEDLSSYFLRKECRKQGLLLKELSPELKEIFAQYNWPGNVAELEQAIEKAVLYNPKTHIITELGTKSTPVLDTSKHGGCQLDHIPHADDPAIPLKDRVCLVEREMILAEIKRHKGNKSKAATAMGISREALRKKLIMSDEIMANLKNPGAAPAAPVVADDEKSAA
ncbi:MAG: sigma 54-interacting transcriptional regulator [Bacteriovoracaceae bacterium]|nr:sigma 54-interacting transcriptional regulator [Bacteriovoracaceae bacterium]